MRYKDVEKGKHIINTKISEATPWYVIGKYSGMVIIRRQPKAGKLVALSTRQLKDFELVYNCISKPSL